MRKVLLLMMGLSVALFAELSRNGDIVSDDSTGLQWQDNTTPFTMTWQGAIDYCENILSLGGHEDWRLPNLNELTSIVDDTQYDPAIDSSTGNGFQNTTSSPYWSSTTHADAVYTSFAWRVFFNNGRQFIGDKSYSYYVRCVRSGQVEPLTCPVGYQIKQGENICILGIQVANPGTYLPNCPDDYRLIQGSKICSPMTEVGDPGAWLPTCPINYRLIQGTELCTPMGD